MNTIRFSVLTVTGLLVSMAMTVETAIAHGVDLTIAPRDGIEVVAAFEGGEPLAEGQVSVFAPGEPAEPWLTGFTDSEGRFFFVPDYTLPGLWEVRVRQAGHGGIIRIEVEDTGVAEARGTGFTTLQKAVMVLAAVWGFIGTALYFRRKAA